MASMPSEPAEPVQVEYTPEFKRNLRALAKKYRHVRSDVQPVINLLLAGEVVGDQVSGTRHTVFKVRVQNSDIQKGKRSGYRPGLSPQDTNKHHSCNDLFKVESDGYFSGENTAHSDRV
ncbi:MAG: hypothetical protein ACT6FD_07560 [Methanosarcinaceae archaeon]